MELFPPMPLAEWQDTKATLHRFCQVVGKIRLAVSVRRNHWWNLPFHLTGRGITTRPMDQPGTQPGFAIDLDFVDQQLRIHTLDDAAPALGTVELWKIRAQNVEHPIHIHLAPFQVISIGGSDPGPYNQGWKDTVNLNNGDYATLLVPSTATGAGTSSTATTWNTRTCR